MLIGLLLQKRDSGTEYRHSHFDWTPWDVAYRVVLYGLFWSPNGGPVELCSRDLAGYFRGRDMSTLIYAGQ